MSDALLSNALLKSAASNPPNDASTSIIQALTCHGLRFIITTHYPHLIDPISPSFNKTLHEIVSLNDFEQPFFEDEPNTKDLFKVLRPYMNGDAFPTPSTSTSSDTINLTRREFNALLTLSQLSLVTLNCVMGVDSPEKAKPLIESLPSGTRNMIYQAAHVLGPDLHPDFDNKIKEPLGELLVANYVWLKLCDRLHTLILTKAVPFFGDQGLKTKINLDRPVDSPPKAVPTTPNDSLNPDDFDTDGTTPDTDTDPDDEDTQ